MSNQFKFNCCLDLDRVITPPGDWPLPAVISSGDFRRPKDTFVGVGDLDLDSERDVDRDLDACLSGDRDLDLLLVTEVLLDRDLVLERDLLRDLKTNLKS